MKRPRVLLLNLSAIGFHSTSNYIHKASINKSVLGFFDILMIGSLDIHI